MARDLYGVRKGSCLTFDRLKEDTARGDNKGSALTEDSLRLALAKLGSKNDQKRNHSYSSSSGRSAHPPARRKFAKDDTVTVEKLPSRLSHSLTRSAPSSAVRSLGEERGGSSNQLLFQLQELTQQVRELKQKLREADQRQRSLEERVEEVQALLETHGQKIKEFTSASSVSPHTHNLQEKTGKELSVAYASSESVKKSSFSREKSAVQPIEIKEDVAPVEWWKG